VLLDIAGGVMSKFNPRKLLLRAVIAIGALAAISIGVLSLIDKVVLIAGKSKGINPEKVTVLYQRTIDQLTQSKLDTQHYSMKAPVPVDLLSLAWQAIGRWSVDFLNSSPDATVNQLLQRIEELNRIAKSEDVEQAFKLAANAIRFDDGTKTVFVVSANYARRGDVFIFQKNKSEPFHLVWSIKDAARASQNRNIHVWDDAVNIEGWGSGPLTGYVYSLPKTSTGHLRFYLDATTNPWAGGTYSKELSVWEWTGKEAVQQFISPYSVSVNSSQGVKLAGSLLKVSLKEELKTFSSCGMCREPEATWNLRITPTGVEDLGTDFLQPEYKFIDALLFRIQKRKTVRGMASDRVAKALEAILAKPKSADDYYLGMLDGGVKTSRQGANEIVSIKIDNENFYELRFTLSHRNGDYYAIDVQNVGWP
jgi:hypothetical protein